MAKSLRQKLILVHVVEAGIEDGASHDGFARCRARLGEEALRVRGSGVDVEGRVVAGSPVEALTQLAETAGAHMLMLSSVGQVAPSRFLAGSVAERAAESSHVPTMIIRKADDLVAWASGRSKLRVLVGCDFSASSDAAIRWALGLRSIRTCEIIVLHVNHPAEDSARLGRSGSPFQNAPMVQRVLLRELRDRVESLGGDDSILLRIAPSWGRIDAELLETARQEQVHLIAVGTHQRHGVSRLWLGSVSRAILRHAASNVAVVPADKLALSGPATPDIRRVLVTTDFSEIGNRAVAHAYSILPAGGTVCLLHVLEGKRGRAAQAREAQTNLQKLIPADADGRNVTTVLEVPQENDVPQAIYRAAERFGADIICIASHGRTALLRSLLGSVAQAVVERSTRPILLIRPKTN